jgi:RecJ-like exonuclease
MKNIAFVISLIGILLLLAIINLIEPTLVEQITKESIDKQIKIQGLANNIKVHENNFTTFYLDEIQIICNCPNIQNNQNLEIIGRVSEFNNELQIEADKITTLI